MKNEKKQRFSDERKKSHGKDIESDSSINYKDYFDEYKGIPTFFWYRAAGWVALAILFLVVTHFTIISTKAFPANKMLYFVSGLFSFGLLIYAGYTLYIGKKKKYFILLLRCTDMFSPQIDEQAKQYFNPNSQTSFRKAKVVVFATEDGDSIPFYFEKGRKFQLGASYLFFFNKPKNDEPITFEMLESLKIDHSLVPTEIGTVQEGLLYFPDDIEDDGDDIDESYYDGQPIGGFGEDNSDEEVEDSDHGDSDDDEEDGSYLRDGGTSFLNNNFDEEIE